MWQFGAHRLVTDTRWMTLLKDVSEIIKRNQTGSAWSCVGGYINSQMNE